MNFNDLLVAQNIDPKEVLAFRHRPTEPDLRKALPFLATERPIVFNAYQQTQGETTERAMSNSEYVASFIGHVPGKAVFVGLYRIGRSKPLTPNQYWKAPGYAELKAYGIRGFSGRTRPTILWFDLQLSKYYSEWKGKLVVAWPPPERSWFRRAHRNDLRVLSIHEEGILGREMPKWDEIVLSWDLLQILPPSWKYALSQWRGVYFIFDTSDGKGYVGAAYGVANLLGRWLHYGASGHGGNRLLRSRDPRSFRFSILELVSPSMVADDVIRLEAKWKSRLHTRAPAGLNDN